MARVRGRDERGSALVEFVWLGLLLLVPLVWVVVTVFEVQRGAFAVTAAARSAGRAYSLAPDDAAGRARAEAAMDLVLADQGTEGMRGRLSVSCTPFPEHCVAGTSTITVRVDSTVALPLMPEILGGDRPGLALSATHSVPVGQYVAVPEGGP